MNMCQKIEKITLILNKWVHHFHLYHQICICDAIKQNQSEVEKYDFGFFGIFY